MKLSNVNILSRVFRYIASKLLILTHSNQHNKVILLFIVTVFSLLFVCQ